MPDLFGFLKMLEKMKEQNVIRDYEINEYDNDRNIVDYTVYTSPIIEYIDISVEFSKLGSNYE